MLNNVFPDQIENSKPQKQKLYVYTDLIEMEYTLVHSLLTKERSAYSRTVALEQKQHLCITWQENYLQLCVLFGSADLITEEL